MGQIEKFSSGGNLERKNGFVTQHQQHKSKSDGLKLMNGYSNPHKPDYKKHVSENE